MLFATVLSFCQSTIGIYLVCQWFLEINILVGVLTNTRATFLRVTSYFYRVAFGNPGYMQFGTSIRRFCANLVDGVRPYTVASCYVAIVN